MTHANLPFLHGSHSHVVIIDLTSQSLPPCVPQQNALKTTLKDIQSKTETSESCRDKGEHLNMRRPPPAYLSYMLTPCTLFTISLSMLACYHSLTGAKYNAQLRLVGIMLVFDPQ